MFSFSIYLTEPLAELFPCFDLLILLLNRFLDFFGKINRLRFLSFYYILKLLFFHFHWFEWLVVHYFFYEIFCKLVQIIHFFIFSFFTNIYFFRDGKRLILLNCRHTIFLLFYCLIFFLLFFLLIFKFIKRIFIDRW
jgi:hypothetical protein